MIVDDESHEHWPTEFHHHYQSALSAEVDEEDHEHWPAGCKHYSHPGTAYEMKSGEAADDEAQEHWFGQSEASDQYTLNGVRYTYLVPQKATASSPPEYHPVYYTYPHTHAQHQHSSHEAQPQRTFHTHYPALPIETRHPATMAPPSDVTFTYRPQKTKPAPTPTSLPWYGRTKQQVNEDNRVIAEREGAYEPRNVVPAMEDGQMAWVTESSGVPMLHSFAAIKGMKGKWQPDPRYKGNWYFVREADDK